MTPYLKRDTFQKASFIYVRFRGGTILHENLKIIWQTPTMVQQNRQPPATGHSHPAFQEESNWAKTRFLSSNAAAKNLAMWTFQRILIHKAVELWNEAVELWYEAVELWNEAVELWNEAVELWNEAVELWNEAVELWNEAVELWNEAVELWNEAVELWYAETKSLKTTLPETNIFAPENGGFQ